MKPSLPELICFRTEDDDVINIPQRIGVNYYDFGIVLLDDKHADIVRALERKHMRDAEHINMDILQRWISGTTGTPVTWETLMKVLHDIERNDLAEEIERVKCNREHLAISCL